MYLYSIFFLVNKDQKWGTESKNTVLNCNVSCAATHIHTIEATLILILLL